MAVSVSSQNKRIAKNTLFMYMRMCIMLIVSLYTSRVILQTLGVEDYGIFTVVGSVIVAFSFLSGPLGTATQRFFTFAIGRGKFSELNSYFSHSIVIYAILSVLLLCIIEVVGLWFIHNKMQLPTERMEAAAFAFHGSLIVFLISIMKTPFEAMVIAQEKMEFYAYISIFDAGLKLLNAFSLSWFCYDKLKLYTVNNLIITALIIVCLLLFCKKKFSYVKFEKKFDKVVFKELLGFSGWSLFGAIASMSVNQGLAILLNMFYGVVVSAAMGVANQVNGAVNQFVSNFQVAFRPQIVKNYAADDLTALQLLVNRTSKLSYLLFFAIMCPVVFNIDYLLHLWLGDAVPDSTGVFCICIMVSAMMETLSAPMWMSVQATGKIKNYQLAISVAMGLNIMLSYALLRLGCSPVVVLVVKCFVDATYLIIRIGFMKKMLDFQVGGYLKSVLWPVFLITSSSLLLMFLLSNFAGNGISRLLVTASVFFCFYVVMTLYVGLTRAERNACIGIVHSKLFVKK